MLFATFLQLADFLFQRSHVLLVFLDKDSGTFLTLVLERSVAFGSILCGNCVFTSGIQPRMIPFLYDNRLVRNMRA